MCNTRFWKGEVIPHFNLLTRKKYWKFTMSDKRQNKMTQYKKRLTKSAGSKNDVGVRWHIPGWHVPSIINVWTKYDNSYTAVIVLQFQRDGSTRIKVHRSHCVCRQNMPRTDQYHIIYFFDSPKIFLLMKNPRRKLSYFSAHISWQFQCKL
jgi:hypothetical protein